MSTKFSGLAAAPATKSNETPIAIKTSEPRDVFAHLDDLYNSIAKRAFELFDGNGKTFGHDVEDWLKAEAELLHPVHLSLTEDDNVIAVEAEVPGFTEKDLAVNVEPQRITISGKRETSEEKKKGKSIRCECHSDEILRVVDLPASVDADKSTATLKNGVLNLRLPKQLAIASDRTKVPIKVA